MQISTQFFRILIQLLRYCLEALQLRLVVLHLKVLRLRVLLLLLLQLGVAHLELSSITVTGRVDQLLDSPIGVNHFMHLALAIYVNILTHYIAVHRL